MPTQSEIENDQYRQIHSLADEVHSLAGAVTVANAINEKLLKLMTRIFYCLFTLLLFCIAAIIYGAIGQNGLYSVRETIPAPRITCDAIPAHNDFDRGIPRLVAS